jgi:hypothetical protein
MNERPDATDERIRSLYLARYTDKEIAVAVGLHRVTVTRRRLALGITSKDRKPIEGVSS